MDNSIISHLGRHISQQFRDPADRMLDWQFIDLLCKLDESEEGKSPVSAGHMGKTAANSGEQTVSSSVDDEYGPDSGC